MKKLALLFCLTVAVSTLAASTNLSESEELPEPGIMPDSTFFAFEKARESISLFLTLDQKEKTEKQIYYAEKRLAAAEKLMGQNKTEAAAYASELYMNEMNEVRSSAERLPEDDRADVEKRIDSSVSSNTDFLEVLSHSIPERSVEDFKGSADRIPESTTREAGRGTGYVATSTIVTDN